MGAIVVGVDYTGESQAALEAGIEEAVRRSATLLLVHHVHLGGSPDPVTEWQRLGEALLARAEAQAAEAGVEARAILDLGSQSAASVILRTAEAPDVELIVIGARRRTRVGKALMGSDAQQVIMGAEVPVLTVKDLHGRPGISVQ
jgi:nucleotide-binding universal stress UspA family protein